MTSLIQLLKLMISGRTLKGIKARSLMALITTIAVLLIEAAAYSIYWEEIPDMIRFDYNFDGVPNDICEKEMIWYNFLLQILICIFLLVLKPLTYRIKRIRKLVIDKEFNLVSILDKRISLFVWELSMLFVTTEQGYIFDLVDVIESPMCDDIVTGIFIFWFVVLVFEFNSDFKYLKTSEESAALS